MRYRRNVIFQTPDSRSCHQLIIVRVLGPTNLNCDFASFHIMEPFPAGPLRSITRSGNDLAPAALLAKMPHWIPLDPTGLRGLHSLGASG